MAHQYHGYGGSSSSSGGGGGLGSSLSVGSITALLKKTEHYDKDERYMATSDLCEVLKRHAEQHAGSNTSNSNSTASSASLDTTTERHICTAVLRLLHDKSNDVQAIAVKTLGVLLTTVQQEQVLEIADSLTDQVLDASKSELRDVYAIGLRTLVKTIPQNMGNKVSQRLVGRLLDGIRTASAAAAATAAASPHRMSSTTTTTTNAASTAAAAKKQDRNEEEIILACLDILTDLLARFGASALSVTRQHEPILQMCLQQLRSPSPVVRKRAGNTMGGLSTVLSDTLLQRMVEAVLRQIDMAQGVGRAGRRKTRSAQAAAAAAAATPTAAAAGTTLEIPTASSSSSALVIPSTAVGDTRALIRTMCTVAGAVGHRLGQEQIDRIIPIFLRFTDPDDAITGDDHDDDGHDPNDDFGSGGGDEEGDDGGDTPMAAAVDDDDGDVDMPTASDNADGIEDDDDDETAVALANELRESCFMGFESFVLRCPVEVEPHLQSILQASLAYMSYDPNYSYGTTIADSASDAELLEDDDGQGEDSPADDDDDEYADEEDDDDDDDDDDDESWKVRRSAIRALKAVVEAKSHNPSPLWTEQYRLRGNNNKNSKQPSVVVAAALLQRFKEREENCRVGIIECFTRLLAVTVAATEAGTLRFADRSGSGSTSDMDMVTTISTTTAATPIIDLQADYAPALVKACQKILSGKRGNERAKSGCLALLATLCKAPGGVGGADQIAAVLTHVKAFLSDHHHHRNSSSSSSTAAVTTTTDNLHRDGASKALRLDALSLVHELLASPMHDPTHVRKSLLQTSILQELCHAVKEQWYKVIAEALRVLAQVPPLFAADADKDAQHVACMLYTSMEPLLAAHDVDQEIKECALKATASLMSSLHGSLTTDQTTRLLSLLLDRLKNESTRISAIKAVSTIAADSKCDLTPILADSVTTMASFLKLQSRSLKQSSLEALDRVVTHHGATSAFVDGQLYTAMLPDVAPLIKDSDLHLTHLSLRATVSILNVCPAAGPVVKAFVLEPALILATSSLLQDVALDSLLALFRQMIVSNAIEFPELLGLLRQRLTEQTGKHGIYNLAKSMAVITATTSIDYRQQVLSEIFDLLHGSPTPADIGTLRKMQLSLLITGDLGRIIDMSALQNSAADQLKAMYLSYFDSTAEDLKHAAAYALGNAAVGSQSTFLQAIVSKLNEEDNKKQQYLLLSSLREFIQCSYRQSGGDAVAQSLPVIVPPLTQHCSDEEEGVRTMVAECMGSLACLQPALMLKQFDDLLMQHSAIVTDGGTVAEDDADSKKNALVCWTVASSIKLAIAGKVDSGQVAQYMPSYLNLLEQEELNVRNAALLMVYSAAHHMPNMIAPLLKEKIVPMLYVVSNLQMQRKVDLGPFTHVVDDALPLRKSALSIFATCLENIPGSLDITAFMPVLAKALGDAEDIQLHAHQIVIGMCSRQPSYLVAAVDHFVDPLEKSINKKPGQKTGTELERLNDWIKSALRVVLALTKVEGTVHSSRKFADFVDRIKANAKFSSILIGIEEER